jgi:CubicO group peptidase (beta-lactamase class C family)
MAPIVPLRQDRLVARTLQQLLDDLDEPGGAACVVVGGEVADEGVAGTLDGARPWTDDTLVMAYSVAKPFAALTVLTVVRDGALGLDQPVADVWPEYAAHGKGATTVRHVLSHRAGLPSFPEAAADVAYDDRETLTRLLAEAVPEHEPGTACAEHALTYGHLCDQLVRGATGEDLAERFAGIATQQGWDVHLRLSPADFGRVADTFVEDPRFPGKYTEDPQWRPASTRPPGPFDPAELNTERWRTTSFAAVNVHASARGIARFYGDLVAEDGAVARLLGAELHRAYVGPQFTGRDRVLDREVTWTLGFQVDDEDIGMGGAGGCAGWFSFTGGYATGYVTRGLGSERVEAVWELLEESYGGG